MHIHYSGINDILLHITLSGISIDIVTSYYSHVFLGNRVFLDKKEILAPKVSLETKEIRFVTLHT